MFLDGNVLVMHDGNQGGYSQDQLMEVTEEVITDQWGKTLYNTKFIQIKF